MDLLAQLLLVQEWFARPGWSDAKQMVENGAIQVRRRRSEEEMRPHRCEEDTSPLAHCHHTGIVVAHTSVHLFGRDREHRQETIDHLLPEYYASTIKRPSTISWLCRGTMHARLIMPRNADDSTLGACISQHLSLAQAAGQERATCTRIRACTRARPSCTSAYTIRPPTASAFSAPFHPERTCTSPQTSTIHEPSMSCTGFDPTRGCKARARARDRQGGRCPVRGREAAFVLYAMVHDAPYRILEFAAVFELYCKRRIHAHDGSIGFR